MNKIWFVSDTHYHHANINKSTSTWTSGKCRDFPSLEDMDQAIVDSINKYVKQDDILYNLGDWSFGGINQIWEFRKRLNVKTIYFVPGNHDHHIINNKILPNVIRENPYSSNLIDGNPNDYGALKIGDGEYPNYVEAQSIFTEVLPRLYNLRINKKLIVLSHYPLESWEEMEKESIHLHGHVHRGFDYTDLNLYNRRMDVGIDWKEFRPFSLEEILEKMNKRDAKQRH